MRDRNILIKKGRIYTPEEGISSERDVLIQEGIIRRIDKGIKPGKAYVLDAQDCIISPGFVDMHVHFREPGMEYKEDIGSGSCAAVSGGYVAVFCMPNTDPPIDNASVAEYVYDRGVDEGLCMVLPHGAITQGRIGKALAPMGEMGSCRAMVRGFSDDGSTVTDSEIMRRAMEYAKTMDSLIISHCEDVSLNAGGQMNEGFYSTLLGLRGIPPEAEEIGVFRDICLAEKTDAELHVAHVSTAKTVKLLREAKKRGLKVTCEATPHHFTLDDSYLVSYDTNLKVNPPLRSRADVEAILAGLSDGTIDVISTDHAPHALHEKETEFDRAEFGMVGLETCLALVVTVLVENGVFSLEQALEKMTLAPSRIMRLERFGYKPEITEGTPANITVFNSDLEWVVDPLRFRSRSKNSPFGGWKVKGKVIHTIFNGSIVLEDMQVSPAGD